MIQRFLRSLFCTLLLFFLVSPAFADSPGADSLGSDFEGMDFWKDYDARGEPLDPKVVLRWEDEFGFYQLVCYRLGNFSGTNKSASPSIAAYYGFPKHASKVSRVPGIVHIHGGGQIANKGRVADWVKLGFAAISINWGGKTLERPTTPNTDWDGLAAGFERPDASADEDLLHHNSVSAGPNTLFREPHPLNSSWNLIAISARRALTFLENRPEVDANRLGVEGHSMGGRATVLTAIDPRVKAASPSVGGSGFLYEDLWGLPHSARRMGPDNHLDLYRRVVSAQAYWPHINAPLLFLQASNDFNAPTDLVFRGLALLPPDTPRMISIAPHLNHRFTADTAAARFLWMRAHLQNAFQFPAPSRSRLVLDHPDGVPYFELSVDTSTGLPVEQVQIFYGYARDPRIRFWRNATVIRMGDLYRAPLPVFDTREPLFAFANITYQIPERLPARPGFAATDRLTVTSEFQTAFPEALQQAGLEPTESRKRTIDDFSAGWQDWYRLNENNPQHWFYATRKILDPTWIGPQESQLVIDLETTAPDNRMAIGIETNTWQNYTGRPRDSFHAVVDLPGKGRHQLALTSADFKNQHGTELTDWIDATELTFTPAHRVNPDSNEPWHGDPPRLTRLRWEGGELTPRPHPHQQRDH